MASPAVVLACIVALLAAAEATRLPSSDRWDPTEDVSGRSLLQFADETPKQILATEALCRHSRMANNKQCLALTRYLHRCRVHFGSYTLRCNGHDGATVCLQGRVPTLESRDHKHHCKLPKRKPAKHHPKPHARPHSRPHARPHSRPHSRPHARPHPRPHTPPHRSSPHAAPHRAPTPSPLQPREVSPTPSPTPSPVMTPTPTPLILSPTPVPAPTPTPVPAPTPTPTPQPLILAPTPTPMTPTPAPILAPTPTPTPISNMDRGAKFPPPPMDPITPNDDPVTPNDDPTPSPSPPPPYLDSDLMAAFPQDR